LEWDSQEKGRPDGNTRKRMLPICRRRFALDSPMSAARKDRKPWPMKWIVLAIALFVPVYTFLTLHYRRPGPAFRPYQDMRDRADVSRLLRAGYQRVAVEARRPADPTAASGLATSPAPGGLPEELRATLVESPLLPLTIGSVSAAPEAVSGIDYQVELTYTLADNKRQLSGAHLYERRGEVVIVADFERLGGDLLSRTREGAARLTIPPGALKPGTYRVTLVGERESRTWTLRVR
jgi:hypothetical protein